jgi:hypothetical protein
VSLLEDRLAVPELEEGIIDAYSGARPIENDSPDETLADGGAPSPGVSEYGPPDRSGDSRREFEPREAFFPAELDQLRQGRACPDADEALAGLTAYALDFIFDDQTAEAFVIEEQVGAGPDDIVVNPPIPGETEAVLELPGGFGGKKIVGPAADSKARVPAKADRFP